ncbi:MAG: hypothetical protein QM719_00415 [Thermomonas sp.]
MNPSLKASLLTLVISAAFAPTAGNAAQVTQIIASSAMAHCQSFTPGVTNTITNRVIGSENTGTKNLGIACAFEVDYGAMTDDGVQSVILNFNNHGTSSFNINCTLAVGPEGDFSYYISKTTAVVPGTQSSVMFTPEDAGSEDLGFQDALVGLTCILPPKAIVNDTYVGYAVDNGA